MDKDKQIIEKLEEKISELNRFVEFLHKAIEEGRGDISDWEETFNVKLTKIKKLESELASLKSQSKTDQCHAIYSKVKEAWTPDKRSFEEVEADKGAGEINCQSCDVLQDAESKIDELRDQLKEAEAEIKDLQNQINYS